MFEGIGTYFESVTTHPDGRLQVGGKVGRRMEAARDSLVSKKQTISLVDFVRLDEDQFNDESKIFLHYQEAAALATYLMDGKGGAYPEAFLDFLRDACHGRISGAAGKSLQWRINMSYGELEREWLEELKAGK